MEIREKRTPRRLELSLIGDVDVYQAPALKVKVMMLAESGELPPRTLLDFRGVKYIDSAGLGAVIDAHRRLGAAGSLVRLVGLSTEVQRVFKFARLNGYLDIESAG